MKLKTLDETSRMVIGDFDKQNIKKQLPNFIYLLGFREIDNSLILKRMPSLDFLSAELILDANIEY